MSDTATNEDTTAEQAYAEAARSIAAKAETPVVELPAFKAKPAKVKPVAAAGSFATVKPATARIAVPAKPVVAKPVVAEAPQAAKPAIVKTAAKTVNPAPTITPAAPKIAQTKPAFQSKEKIMTTTTKITDEIKSVVADVQGKAKLAYAKGSVMLGEAGEFTKGNAEAVVASGKILATGVKSLGEAVVADSKETFELFQAQAKALSSVKSPTDFVKLQGDFARTNFDKAISYGTKNTETMLKLTSDMFAPISGRFSLAMDMFRKAA